MDIHIGFAASALIAGILSFFSPCILPLLPVYIGYFAASDEKETSGFAARMLKTLSFVLGVSVVFFSLGIGAGLIGSFFSGSLFTLFCGIFILFMGLCQTGAVKVPVLERSLSPASGIKRGYGIGGAFLLGLVFSFSWTPCIGPILSAIIGISLEEGHAFYGGALLLLYTLGLSVPFLLMAAGSHILLTKVRAVYPYLDKIKIAGGILICFIGIWMIAQAAKRITYQQTPAASNAYESTIDTPGGAETGTETTDSESGPDTEGEITAGTTAEEPSREPDTLSGEYLTLSDFEGKTVYLKFWATWCPVCLSGMSEYEELYEAYSDRGDIAIYSVIAPDYYGEMDRELFSDWANGQQISFPVLFDDGGILNEQFGIRAYPTSVFLDGEGSVLEVHAGHLSNEQIANRFEKYTG